MEILSQRETVHEKRYYREFLWRNDPSAGFSFDCDDNGELKEPEHPEGRENLSKCLSGVFDVIDTGVKVHKWKWVQPAVGKCSCGRKVELYDPLDNECECGLCYNMSGQQVVPSWKCDEQGNPYDYDW